jgi:hypothetical protein
MATFTEHMVDDFRRLLDEHGETHMVDGEPLLCLLHPVELQPGAFEQLMIERQKLSSLPGSCPERYVGQEVEVDLLRWQLISIHTAGASVTWVMERRVV